MFTIIILKKNIKSQHIMINSFFEQTFKNTVHTKQKAAQLLNCNYKFIIEGPHGGIWRLICKTSTPHLTQTEGPADCILSIHDTDFIEILKGHTTAHAAFLKRKLKITGNIRSAMRLGSLM